MAGNLVNAHLEIWCVLIRITSPWAMANKRSRELAQNLLDISATVKEVAAGILAEGEEDARRTQFPGLLL